MKVKNLVFIAICTILFSACKDNSQKTNSDNNDGDPITYFKDDDKAMNDAIEKAVNTFDQFEKAFVESQKDGKYDGFTIKMGFPTKDGSKEHMWLSDLTFDGKQFSGILANQPAMEVDVKYGSKVVVKKDMISDWMYFDADNKVYGGYTMRVMRDAMSPEERALFDEQTGFVF